ncbi:hypothetical protein [Rhizobium sp. SL86]|uniref:hypothetical protein n=1 Tax=Rhizobium sp. SL86 TaxID=2995148 RepID=UPI002275A6B3|nr:hypothetical protein [Rhizobium sp. SL86]MCY1667391.1 hypothetical protein [Rhizobium sp. SL86]
MFSKIAVRTLVAGIALISTSSSASTDPAIAAGLFWAAVAAVEDRCERYSSVVEAFAWDRFSDQEYGRVIEAARIHKPFVVALISNLSCYGAASYVAAMANVSPARLWEIR